MTERGEQGGLALAPTFDMERAIARLALEVPAEVWEDVRNRWWAARDALHTLILAEHSARLEAKRARDRLFADQRKAHGHERTLKDSRQRWRIRAEAAEARVAALTEERDFMNDALNKGDVAMAACLREGEGWMYALIAVVGEEVAHSKLVAALELRDALAPPEQPGEERP